MTRDEWRDIVATMSPKQREAMCVFAEACTDLSDNDCPPYSEIREALDGTLQAEWGGARWYLDEAMGGPAPKREPQPTLLELAEKDHHVAGMVREAWGIYPDPASAVWPPTYSQLYRGE